MDLTPRAARASEKETCAPIHRVGETVRHLLVVAALVLGVFVAFGPLLEAGFINYDDPLFIVGNVPVSAGLRAGCLEWAFTAGFLRPTPEVEYWEPLVVLSRMLDFSLFWNDAKGHHLTSVLLQALNAVLLYGAVFAFSRDRVRSALVAMLFALHPLNVEVAGWLSARKDLLAGTFSLLTVITYGAYRSRPGWGRYLALLGVYGLAAMTKPAVMAVPVLLFVLDGWPFQVGISRRTVLEKLPLLLIAVAVAWLAWKSQVGFRALQPLEASGLGRRLANVPVNCMLYLGQWIWPTRLSIHYPIPFSVGGMELGAAVSIVVGLSAAAWVLRRKMPGLLAGWLWFLVGLGPVIGLVGLGSSRLADRYMYVPMMGLLVGITFLPWQKWLGRDSLRRGAIAGGVAVLAILVGLGWLSFRQAQHWHDSVSVFTQAQKLYPESPATGLNLALSYNDEGRYREAVAEGVRVQRWEPNNPRIWAMLGTALGSSGHQPEAIRCLDRALELDHRMVGAHLDRGRFLSELGSFQQARDAFGRAVEAGPDAPECFRRRALFFAEHRLWPEAVADTERMLELWPHNPEYVLVAAKVSFWAGDRNRALGVLRAYRTVLGRNMETSLRAQQLVGEITGKAGD